MSLVYNLPTPHTPGPWFIAKHDTGRRVVDVKGRSVLVASRRPDGAHEANTALAAAAPDLLAALRHLDAQLAYTNHAEDHPWRTKLRTAIALAGA